MEEDQNSLDNQYSDGCAHASALTSTRRITSAAEHCERKFNSKRCKATNAHLDLRCTLPTSGLLVHTACGALAASALPLRCLPALLALPESPLALPESRLLFTGAPPTAGSLFLDCYF
eukprot:scaffold17959_cov76-Phaeocystis_antarctica.AAC.2